MSEYSRGEKESWNMANATLKRLSDLMTLCSIHAQHQQFGKWYLALMDLKRNMSPFLEDDEEKDLMTILNQLPKGWTQALNNYDADVTPQIHKAFDKIYISLVRHMKTKGLLMPKTVDANKAITGM